VSLPPTTSTLISTVEVFSTISTTAGSTLPSDSADRGDGTSVLSHTPTPLHSISGGGSISSLSSPAASGSSSHVHATPSQIADQGGPEPTLSASVSSRASTHSLVAPIIGAVVGVLVLIALGIIFLRLRRRRRFDRYLEDINREGSGLRPSPYMAHMGPASPINHSSVTSMHSLSHNPLLYRSSNSTGSLPHSAQASVPPDGPFAEPVHTNLSNVFVPLKQQRGPLLIAGIDAPPTSTADVQLQERVNVLEDHISRMAATSAPVSWGDELPPAYDTPRTPVPR
jgi:hypothetical protein